MSQRRALTNDLISIRKTYADDDTSAAVAHLHTVINPDKGSCKLPKGGTITLEEWKRQQAEEMGNLLGSVDEPGEVFTLPGDFGTFTPWPPGHYEEKDV